MNVITNKEKHEKRKSLLLSENEFENISAGGGLICDAYLSIDPLTGEKSVKHGKNLPKSNEKLTKN